MTDILPHLMNGFALTGELSHDAPAFLRHHDRSGVATHVELVAANARELAERTGADVHAAQTAAWLHDISRVLPGPAMVEPALYHGITLVPEERQLPELIHGKLSAVFAEKLFGVHDPAVLDAIRCHTTLRGKPTLLDKVLFIADKLSWQPDEAPYLGDLEAQLARSLDCAVGYFLDWSWQQGYPVIHPWLREAYQEFSPHTRRSE